MDREWRVKVEETNRHGVIADTFKRTREMGKGNPQHVLGEMLGDAIVSMASDDAANVLQALIQRLDVLDDESIKPFSQLASYWRAWWVRGGDVAFSYFVDVKEAE